MDASSLTIWEDDTEKDLKGNKTRCLSKALSLFLNTLKVCLAKR